MPICTRENPISHLQVYRAGELGLDYRGDPRKDMYEWKKRTPRTTGSALLKGKCRTADECLNALVLAVNQHIQGTMRARSAHAIGVNTQLGTGNIVYAGHLRKRRQHDGVELRHQLFPLGKSQAQNDVRSGVDSLVRNQPYASVCADVDDAKQFGLPPGNGSRSGRRAERQHVFYIVSLMRLNRSWG